MRKYKLIIAYDGTAYVGWQIQPNGCSIQAAVQEGLSRILQQTTDIVGAGRTDAGVHAVGQVAHFLADERLEPARVRHSLNCLLPPDIRILALEVVESDFHARYSAKRKFYSYSLATNRVFDPFYRLYRWHYPQPLDLGAMRKAAAQLLGTHDFSSFANAPEEGSVARNPVRELTRCELVEDEGVLRFELEGPSFLYKMVRNIVGTLIEIGSGKLSDMAAILSACDRRKAGQAAPPHGLCLEAVYYTD